MSWPSNTWWDTTDMGFLFKAAFWIALAAYLVPSDFRKDFGFDGAQAAAADPAPFELKLDQAYLEAANLCLNNPDLCVAGVDMMDAAQDLAVQGIDALAGALDEEDRTAAEDDPA
jgi:hypothetical protein